MLAWMLYVIMVTVLLSLGAYVAERAARLNRGGTRWIWLTAIIASLLLPTVIASVTVQLPNVTSPAVAQHMVVLRETTTQVLSPVTWISGSAGEPAGWREFDSLLTTAWRAASVAMLLALIASGAHLFMRRRRWRTATVAGAQVYVTEGVGPAVVGLLRPRIVVPQWVTMALPRHQAAVIAHEQSHLDARDPQLLTLALALLVFMPWNLPLWWQLRRLRYAIEVDCDARVLRGGIDPTHYGETLISVGERQSAYIGAVAAMSESKSFLEERIRIMISKPVKWRRAGIAALAGISLALTALAAQVSPPNAVDAPAAQGGGAPKSGARVAIKLPAETLDRYVGHYQVGTTFLFTVRRDGDRMLAQLTGQPEAEIFAESESSFFYKAVEAQLDFRTDGAGPAGAVTLHQNGQNPTWPRIDDATASQIRASLDAKVQSQAANPASEAALIKLVKDLASGNPDYDQMSPEFARVTREQLPALKATIENLGAIQTVDFRGVSPTGWDLFEIGFEKGRVPWRIHLDENGRIDGALLQSF
jgi:beta-lactamase regulating signal transducer with metallopeptidase domain